MTSEKIILKSKHTRYLNAASKKELISQCSTFLDDVISEAERLEAATNNTSSTREITSHIISTASSLVKGGFRLPKKSLLMKIFQAIAILGGIWVGILYDADKFKVDTYYLFYFLFIFTLTTIATIIAIFKE